jgi:hypothetical protein
MSDTAKRVLWTAAQAFLAIFVLGALGILSGIADAVQAGNVPDWGAAASALLALAGAAAAAALSAIKNMLFRPDSPAR